MVRTQIQLTEQQARRLRAQAHDRRISLAEMVRRCVDRGLADDKPDRAALYERAAQLVGGLPARRGTHDISARHDHYLDEAFE